MPDLIGRTIGPYRILEQIGVGGMATVYKAYQLNMERDVALKILPHYLAQDETFAKRFQREAHAIARLEHAHILPVYDFGDCDGVTFIAMRYMPAGTLKERLARGPLPLAEVARLVGQIGGALDYAHRQGVIHRDVKPGNVLVDAEGEAYLTDFGLARMLETSQHLTASGVGVGTPAYMAPEQGQGLPADPRSDLYSLGVILFELVTGRVPFEAETPMAVVIKHITEPLPLPRTVRPDVPEPVEKVILKALAKDPAHRYQNAAELVQALDRAVQLSAAGAPTVAALTRAALPAPKPPFRLQAHHAMRAALALLGGLAVIVVAAYLWNQWRPSAAPASPTPPSPIPTVAAVVPSAEPRPTQPAATAQRPNPTQPASPPWQGRLRLRLTSSSDWAELQLPGGYELLEPHSVQVDGQVTKAELASRMLHLDQTLEQAQAGKTVHLAYELVLASPEAGSPIRLTVSKGCLGEVTVEVINLAAGLPLLVHSVTAAGCDPLAFDIAQALLTTTTPPQVSLPHEPRAGKELFWCEESLPRKLCQRDRTTGEVTRLTPDLPMTGDFGTAAWSPDGRQIVFSAARTKTEPQHLYVINADGSGLTGITAGDAFEHEAVWSPDGEWIAYHHSCQVWLVRPDGADAHPIIKEPEAKFCTEIPSWSPDSQRLVVISMGRDQPASLWSVNRDGSNPHPIFELGHLALFGHARWSPDGRQIAWEASTGGLAQHWLIDVAGGYAQRLAGFPYWWAPAYWPPWGLAP